MYDLHQLGWYSFQQLSLTVVREVFGQTTMLFSPTSDGGRDGCFTGEWQQSEKLTLQGSFVFQCKFSNIINYQLKFSDLSEEIPKAIELYKQGLCDNYLIITNAKIMGRVSAKIEQKFKQAGINKVVLFGAEWLDQTIRENTRLRRLVPRLYGLGDLSQILDERVYAQGRTLLESLKDELAKVVITSAYNKAAEAIDKHGFVLLIGQPAAGKTTIASLLAMGALDQWGATTLKIDTADQISTHWNPDDPQQFFWIDDAFGVTQYESSLVHQWNHKLPQIKAMITNGAKIVMTSRDYIYNRARNDLKESAFPLFKEQQVVIDVHNLTLVEKQQILYNHLKMGNQKPEFKSAIKPFLQDLANLERFSPEAARRLGSSFFTQDLLMYKWSLEDFVTKQETFLIEVIRGLDQDSLGALALVYMNSDKLPSPLELNSTEKTAIERLSSSLGGCSNALLALRGNLVQFIDSDSGNYWKFKHPTIADAFAKYIALSPELIEIYLRGTPPNKLLAQVTCGDVGIEKSLIIHKGYFPLMIDKLSSYTQSSSYKSNFLSSWSAKRDLLGFLATRCSGDFLVQYLKTNPTIINEVTDPSRYLEHSPEVSLTCRLHTLELLPEGNRKLFVENVSKYLLSGESGAALESEKIRSLFTHEETEDLMLKISNDLIPNLSTLTQKYEEDYSHDTDADDHMESLLNIYSILKEKFESNQSICEAIEEEERRASRWIRDNTQQETGKPRRATLADNTEHIKGDLSRNIFDDVDK